MDARDVITKNVTKGSLRKRSAKYKVGDKIIYTGHKEVLPAIAGPWDGAKNEKKEEEKHKNKVGKITNVGEAPYAYMVSFGGKKAVQLMDEEIRRK